MEQPERVRLTTRQRALLWVMTIIFLLVLAAYSAEWTGFPGKSLWDWLELLIVPAALAVGGFWLTRSQRERQRDAEEARRERELEVENLRAQDVALQSYLDQIGQLLLDKDRPLRQSAEGDEVSTLARAQTLTALTRLDSGRRKRSILQFLYESGLIAKDHAIVDLAGADLRNADLLGLDLREADLRGADLRWATLEWADLRGADLRGAHLREANWLAADLRGADLRHAYMWDLKGMTNEELERHAGSLEGAIMPDGLTYETWLKSR